MNPERWNAVKKLLQKALELPQGEIESFLDQTCGDDIELRREVEALVRADDRAGRFLDRPSLR